MSSRVVHAAAEFEKEAQKLKRKYPAVSSQIRQLVFRLIEGELPGVRVPKSILQTYKVRLPNPSARRGKSGGFRVIYSVSRADAVVLITIYSKTEQNDLSPHELQQRIKQIEETDRDDDPDQD